MPSATSPRRIALLLVTTLLGLAGCTSAQPGNSVIPGGTSSSVESAGQTTRPPSGPGTDALAADLPAVLALSPAEQDAWLRRTSMAFELQRGEASGLVAAVGGRAAYAQILADQAAWFGKQLAGPSLRRPAHAFRGGDSINDPKVQVGLGQALGGAAGGGQDVGEDEWDRGDRGDYTDPKNPENTVNIGDNNVDSTIHLDPFDNDQVHTEMTLKKHSEMCPDPNGKIKADYTFDIDSVSKTGGGNYHGTWIVGVTAQLDDDAQIVSVDMDFLYQNGGSAGPAEELSGRWPHGADGAEPIKDGPGFAFIAMMSKQFQAKNVEQALKKTIERGKCVALGLSASDGPDGLATDTEVTITATPTAVMDGAQANGTVQVKLASGSKSVSPEGQKSAANPSATFTYTSAEKTDEKGTVGFEARSRRGVGKDEMTLTTGECMVGTWTMDNDSWTGIVGPIAAQYGADMKGTGGPIVTTFTKDGKFEFTFNGFTQQMTMAQGSMTVVYGGKDTGTWKRTGQGRYVITGLKAGVHAKATADFAGQHMDVPMDYQAALQPNTTFTCTGDVLSAQTPYGDVTSTRQGS